MAVRSWGWGPGVRGPFLAGVGTPGSAPHSRDNPGPLPLREVLWEPDGRPGNAIYGVVPRWGWWEGDPWTCELSLLDKRPDIRPQDSSWSPIPAGDLWGSGSPTNRVVCVRV